MYDIDYQIPIISRQRLSGCYYDLPLDQNDPRYNEPLVRLKDHGIAFESYYALSDGSNPPYYRAIEGSISQGWIRQTLAQKLVAVNRHLHPYGVELLILDAYRPMACQRGLWAFFYQKAENENPGADDEACRQYAMQFVRDPAGFDHRNNSTGPAHLTGGAIDATLRKLSDHKPLDMGSYFEEIVDASYTDYFERLLAKGEILPDDPRLNNRRLLHWALHLEGFLNDPVLFWHHDWGNQLWLKTQKALTDEKSDNLSTQAWYGIAEPPDGQEMHSAE